MILQELMLVIRKVARGRLLAAIMFMVAGTGASAAAQVLPPQGVDLEKGNVELALDRTSYAAGSPVALAVRLSIEDNFLFHTPFFDIFESLLTIAEQHS